jgi:hypothetical protein
MWSALRILGGLAGLLAGAELLVRGSTALAARLGIRPMVIGLTVVITILVAPSAPWSRRRSSRRTCSSSRWWR